MIKSMTGYGRSEIKSDTIYGQVEARAKNHRYLDIRVMLPKELNSFEIPISKLVSGRVSRGKIDLSIKLTSVSSTNYSLTINKELLKEYKEILTDLKVEFGYNGQIDIVNVAQFRDLITVNEDEAGVEGYYPAIEAGVLDALNKLDDMRSAEGAHLKDELVLFIANIAAELGAVEAAREKNVEQYHEKVREKITAILDQNTLDENRVYQEISYIIDKTDITEEIARLKSHFAQFASIIKEESPVGKKLDFLFQELSREINTIASKANDFNIASHTIKMKNELEKAREQAQNIE